LVFDIWLLPEEGEISFYLNPGLEAEQLLLFEQGTLSSNRENALVQTRIPSASKSSGPFHYLIVHYRGTLSETELFQPKEAGRPNTSAPLFVFAPESLFTPWMPDQSYSGRLRIITPAEKAPYGPAGETRIIEREGVRQTDIEWKTPLWRLGLAASIFPPARVQRDELIIEMVTHPKLAWDRGRFYDILQDKLAFFEQAFHPFLKHRLTIVAGPENAPPALDAHAWLVLPEENISVHLLGDPLLDRMLARQWFGEILQFPNTESAGRRGWVEFAARFYLEETFPSRAQTLWETEGEWITRVIRPYIPLEERLPWILRMIQQQVGRMAFWELNQEFFQRNLYRQVTFEHYIRLGEEILIEPLPGGKTFREFITPWLEQNALPALTYSVEILEGTSTRAVLSVKQQTPQPREFPVEIVFEPGEIEHTPTEGWTETVFISRASHQFEFDLPSKDTRILVDPKWKTLFKRTHIQKFPADEQTHALD
jgi:hypothetical protein